MHRTPGRLAAASLLVASLAGCGLGSAGAADPTLVARPHGRCDPAMNAALSAPLRQRGAFRVAMVPDTPPMAYYAEDDATIVGFDRDMSQAIADVFCVGTEPIPTNVDAVVPGLAAGRYDLVLASLAPTDERRKRADFVTYYNGGQGFLAAHSTGFPVNSYTDLCGRAVAVVVGSVQQSQLDQASGTCAAAGRPAWRLSLFPNGSAAVLALRSDRVDVLYFSISLTQYVASKSPGLFRLAGRYKRAIVALGLERDSPLTGAVHEAVSRLMADGTYRAILGKWGLQENSLDGTEILKGRS
jgi:polar amino acid transport system substrate-binding protein